MNVDPAAQTPAARIAAMAAEVRRGPEVIAPSRFWEEFNEFGLRVLDEHGLEEFKRTINSHYFQWLPTGPRDPQFRRMLARALAHPTRSTLRARLDPDAYVRTIGGRDPFGSALARRGFAWYVAALWAYVQSRDRAQLTSQLEEPSLGHPLAVHHDGRRLSQDLGNSALELVAIMEALPSAPPGAGVLELGSGYGRVAWAFLECFPRVRYILVDLPPALAVAEWYLTTLYPDRTTFRFRSFDRYETIAESFESAQIAFLTPNQMRLLPPASIGLALNISSLHEMTVSQIAYYLAEIDRIVDGHFYTKQWIRSLNPYDGLVVRREDYPIPSHWTTVFDRRHPVQTRFFEALYATRPSTGTGRRPG